jgi:gliding motility-associated-like protein
MKKLIFISISVLKTLISAQSLSVSTNVYTPEELVKQVLIGQNNNNVTITNIKFNNVPINASTTSITNQFGYFDVNTFGNTNPLGFDKGVILSSGGIANAIGPNNQIGATTTSSGPKYNTDPDLISLGSTNIYDAAVLEFDIIPVGSTINFRYRFASEEYSANACDVVNDAFGFFVSGPGITGTKNIALVPYKTTPVSVNTINMGKVFKDFNTNQYYFADSSICIASSGSLQDWQSNKIYFQNNDFKVPPNAPPPDSSMYKLIQHNGITVPLMAEIKNLLCGQTYHIKLAISDVVDSIYDSSVFIEAGSFKSSSVALVSNTNLSDASFDPGLVYEDCVVDTVTFTRDTSNLSLQTFQISYAGSTADTTINGDFVDDFGNPLALPTSVTFPPSILSMKLIFRARQDNIVESPELLNIKVIGLLGTSNCLNNTPDLQIYLRDQLKVNALALRDSTYSCPNAIVTLSGRISGVLKNIKYAWYYGNGNIISKESVCKFQLDTVLTNYSMAESKTIYFLGKDFCGNISIDTIIIKRQPYFSISGNSFVSDKDCPKDTVALKAVVTGGVVPYYFDAFEKVGTNAQMNINLYQNEDTLLLNTDTINLLVMPSKDAIYTIRVWDQCRLSPKLKLLDTVHVGKNILPLKLDTLADSLLICRNQSLSLLLKANGGVKPYRFNWSQENSKDSILSVKPQDSQWLNYSISDRCEVDSINDSIFINVSFVIANFENTIPEVISASNSSSFGDFYPTKFNNLSTTNDSNLTYEWYLNGIKISTDKNFEMTLDYNKDNIAKLISTNSNGCISIYERPIAGQSFIYMPNVFTPNKDQVNDKFASINTGVINYHLKIFDRWGSLIYESTNAEAGWDGTFQGRSAIDGTYFIVLKYNERESKKEKKYQGYLQLVGAK